MARRVGRLRHVLQLRVLLAHRDHLLGLLHLALEGGHDLVVLDVMLPSLDGYLTQEGKINFRNLDVLFKDISKLEEELFKLH